MAPALGFLLAVASTLLPGMIARAQTTDPWMADGEQIAAAFKQHPSPRHVVVVFDISGSMRSKVPETGLTRWQEARAATSQLLTSTLGPGDSLTIEPFDSVVHDPQQYPNLSAGQLANIGKFIPDAISGETGTNMRLAHDQALQSLQREYTAEPAGKRPWQAIVVVSDGFNDAPPIHSPAWYDYAKFCNVHVDNQNLYPDTPECSAWRRESQEFEKSGEGETFGIGVKIKDGVPEYRPPGENPRGQSGKTDQTEGEIAGAVYDGDRPAAAVRVAALDSHGNEVDAATSGQDGHFLLSGLAVGSYTLEASGRGGSAELPSVQTGDTGVDLHMAHSLLWLWITLAVLAVLAAVGSAAIARSRRTSKVRIQIKDPTGKNRTYWMGGGSRVSIGGKEAPGVFPLEAFGGPVVHLRHSANGYTLQAEKGVEVETGGRKFSGVGPVNENSTIQVRDSNGAQGGFEFRDISTRTRTAAAAVAAPTEDAYSKLDASLKG